MKDKDARFTQRELKGFLTNAHLAYVRELETEEQDTAIAAGIVLLKQARTLDLTKEERVLALLSAAFEEAFPIAKEPK